MLPTVFLFGLAIGAALWNFLVQLDEYERAQLQRARNTYIKLDILKEMDLVNGVLEKEEDTEKDEKGKEKQLD